MREVTVGDQPWGYLSSFERMMRRRGFSADEIDIAVAPILALIIGLERGTHPADPRPICPDGEQMGYYIYAFDTGALHGRYASCGDKVRLIELAFRREALRALGFFFEAA